VRENVAFGLRARGGRGADVERRVDAELTRVGLKDLGARQPGELSGGQQQRVALARALILEPRLLLLDEPLSALDLQTRRTVRGELRRLLADLPCTTVFVTHSPIEALLFGDSIAVLEQGKVSQVGSRDELLRRPRTAYVAEFMGVNLLQGRAGEGSAAGTTEVTTRDGTVTVATGDTVSAEELFVAVSPREITLYRTPPDGSARNLYRGRVVELVPEPPFGERVRVVLDTHPPLVAEVTRAAAAELELVEGQELFASFKATGAIAYS
jgi:molybdate transport system ATP-binding protein